MQHQNKPDLLIVDDDPLISDTLCDALGSEFAVHTASSRYQARAVLRALEPGPKLALIDLGLPPTPNRPDEGFRLISELVAQVPEMRIVVLGCQDDAAHFRHACALGAVDFVRKPCDADTLGDRLKRVLRMRDGDANRAGGLLGTSPGIEALRVQIDQYADAPFPVLIEGESGSGKELAARSLHLQSRRAGQRFLALNCAALSPTLVEPTLFGYAKGAFTGAHAARAGYFEEAQDSTLFLDEIGELPLELQAKLLRVLENGEFQRVGETHGRISNARVVAATNRDMRREVHQGRFRADLYHRLSVFTLTVPPLRELAADRLLLLEHFRDHHARQTGAAPFRFSAEATAVWMRYGFPGNVRELRNIVIRLTAKYSMRTVTAEQLEAELDRENSGGPAPAEPSDQQALMQAARRHLEGARMFSLDRTLAQWEQGYVEAALSMTQGNLTRAARLLGVHRTTLYSRMQNYADAAARALLSRS